MKDIIFILSSWSDVSKVTRCFQFAYLAAVQEKRVLLFLVDEGVYAGTDQLAALGNCLTGDKAFTHYTNMQVFDTVEIKMCKPCSQARGISAEDLLPGVTIGSGPELISVMSNIPVVTF